MRLYLAGPMTSKPKHNYPAFNEAELVLSQMGHQVFNPARNFDGRDDLPYNWYIREDLKLMSFADGIVFLPDWRYSNGCLLEYHVAFTIGMHIYEYDPVKRDFYSSVSFYDDRETLAMFLKAKVGMEKMREHEGRYMWEDEVWENDYSTSTSEIMAHPHQEGVVR